TWSPMSFNCLGSMPACSSRVRRSSSPAAVASSAARAWSSVMVASLSLLESFRGGLQALLAGAGEGGKSVRPAHHAPDDGPEHQQYRPGDADPYGGHAEHAHARQRQHDRDAAAHDVLLHP